MVPDSDDEETLDRGEEVCLDGENDNENNDLDNNLINGGNNTKATEPAIEVRDTLNTPPAAEYGHLPQVPLSSTLNPTRTDAATTITEADVPDYDVENLHVAEGPRQIGKALDVARSEIVQFSGNEASGRFSGSSEGPLMDDVSTSYVRVSSSFTSSLSSVPSSQATISGDTEIPVPRTEPVPQTFLGQGNDLRRALRQRNPNQLKPYTVEQVKYRAVMKARGMAPTRIEQTPDEISNRRGTMYSSEHESQEFYSQELDLDTQDSQQENVHSSPLPASPKQKTSAQHQKDTADPFGSEDDELPDIDELLLRRDFLPKSSKVTHPKKTYSGKPKFKKHRSINFKPRRQERKHNKEKLDIFDVPASPPTTSPLPEVMDRTLYSGRPRALSFTSQEPVTSSLDINEPSFDLPTPATSAIKHAPSPILVNCDTDSDDPFASDLASKASPEYSSDESIQIRKVGKKIRGVLPASHLRLNQLSKNINIPPRNERLSISASPEKQPFRRGVAIPKISGTINMSPTSTNFNNPIFSDDSDGSETQSNWGGFFENDNDLALDHNFDQQRNGVAEVEDRVDPMLPGHKRQRDDHATVSRKKRRLPSGRGISSRQPKITDNLREVQKSVPSMSRRHGKEKSRTRRPLKDVSRPRKSILPNLSILDVTSNVFQGNGNLPLFIKVAARTARNKINQGRQSPSRKFIRLATREDTADAQSVLQDWKDGKIKPKPVDSYRDSKLRIESKQTRLNSPISKTKSKVPHFENESAIAPRRLLITKDRQQSMKDFVNVEDHNETSRLPPQALSRWDTVVKQRTARPIVAPPSRPAQLETSEATYSSRYPTNAFKSTKKSLDSFYKATQKRRSNVQISRFLADGDIIRPSSETIDASLNVIESAGIPEKIPRGRKRLPQRLDAGASVFRQSSEPLILQYVVSVGQDLSGQDGKLIGLGKFGTKYPVHFDILPLQSGIHFHQSTFIGGGHLYVTAPNIDVMKPALCFDLGEREFRWSFWNENVSSEIGLCFDWILDQLSQRPTNLNLSSQDNPANMVTRISDYVQTHMIITSPEDRVDFLSRMIEIMSDFAFRIGSSAGTEKELQAQFRVSVASRCTVLALQILHISQRHSAQASTSAKLETILVAIAQSCIKMLLFHGLDDVRALYEKLQYLSFREGGITDSHFSVEAWLIVIRTLSSAKIPRCSFWDVTNKLLLNREMLDFNDAREMEKLWYSVFSLLPLSEFNEFGVVVQGARHTAFFDNWELPQRMLKSVFTLYSSTARQSPGFNDYCRTLVSRCHLLMLDWGWWKCGVIIGTLFDFFASQNLAHLRNEEVHNSPHFLEELDTEPSLSVEPEDRCFHILLKIIALEIKHLREINEEKGIRNLVTRLLPNHNRQYPKEETILERELAALRNHHDLLATLYWAAPVNQRPSPSLIQNLVEPDRSHNAACLINLRAWKQLSVFLLASPTPNDAFEPFISWQNTFFTKLLEQYLQEEVNTRKQAEGPSGDSIPEKFLLQQIMSNRASTMTMLCQIMTNMMDAIVAARNISGLEAALNRDILGQLFNNEIVLQDEGMIIGITRVVYCYIDKVNTLHPYEYLTIPDAENESQDSIGIDLRNWERNRLLTVSCALIIRL